MKWIVIAMIAIFAIGVAGVALVLWLYKGPSDPTVLVTSILGTVASVEAVLVNMLKVQENTDVTHAAAKKTVEATRAAKEEVLQKVDEIKQ